MGDRTYVTIRAAKKYEEYFKEMASQIDELDDRIIVCIEEANYGGCNEITQILKDHPNIAMIFSWDAGGDYGPGRLICFEGKRAEVELTFDGFPIIALYSDSITLELDQMKDLANYFELKAKVEASFKEGADAQDNHGTH